MSKTMQELVNIEQYVVKMMESFIVPEFKVGHALPHTDRVRRRARYIAEREAPQQKTLVEAAALLHDVGLTQVTERRHHGTVGAECARQYLDEHQCFSPAERTQIAEAIQAHTQVRGGGIVGDIVRDADILDMLGAVGIMRAFQSLDGRPAYHRHNVKGETWGITADGITQRFTEGKGTGETIVDHLNFQLSCAENLSTHTAKTLARPLHTVLRDYILQLECEVAGSSTHETHLFNM
jgi:putative nucleotidyltransferase with HDIG domain